MKKERRYKTSHLLEDQYEPGSGKRVLKNLRGIKRKREMDREEVLAQLRAFEEVTKIYGAQHKFTEKDICDIHKIWLGKIYSWAGQYRSVNISKGGFSFAAAREIPKLMGEFERDVLYKYTPCCSSSQDEMALALAIVHVELVLIHPFREGNGRMSRVLAILMALQGGLPVLDFGSIQGKKKAKYFAAVRAGLSRDYRLMTEIFKGVIKRTVRKFSSMS